MYSEILNDIINRLEVIEDLTVTFRQRNLDGQLPLCMVAPSNLSVTNDVGITDLQANYQFTITLYADNFSELLLLIERIETAIQLDNLPINTSKFKYLGFKLAPTESPTDSIEPCEMTYSCSIIRNL